MKIPVLFVVLIVLYCVAADDTQKKANPTENGEGSKPEEAVPPSSSTTSPNRARRSPPRFDANQMKGKYAKTNKVKGSLASSYDTERLNRHERSIADYLSPSSTLIYAVQPPVQQKTPEATHSIKILNH